MKHLLIIPFALFATTLISLEAEEDAPEANPSGVIQIRFVKALDAFRILSQAEPDYALIVKDVDSRTNTIHLEREAPAYEKAVKFLERLDQRPQQFKIDSKIVEITGQGPGSKERVLSRPVVHTLAGKTATISFQLENGKFLRIELSVSEIKENPDSPAGNPLAR